MNKLIGSPNLQLRLLPWNVAEDLTYTCVCVGASVYLAHLVAIAIGMACMVAVLALARLSLWPSVGLRYYFTTRKMALPLLALITGALISAVCPAYSILQRSPVSLLAIQLSLAVAVWSGASFVRLVGILDGSSMAEIFELMPGSDGDKREGASHE
ncbi:hypothetical protein [Rhodanobacter sp. DHB23]|uniref:hypothetical protein n=1 Tax=Rhodanobacter sp. DHB23 TaxID=2775923 RepID=UPI0017830691|nr:hypothetical protein [Rhodanobacter sp. DHB23]MBD8872457.1 hypothetical protein [Rhodanobacter sp. DHB23]